MTLITTSFNVATGGGCACCGGSPASCPCALPLSFAFGVGDTFASITDAQNALLYNTYGCYAAGFAAGAGIGVANTVAITLNTATPGTSILTVVSGTDLKEFIIAYLDGSFDGPATLTFAYTNSSSLPVGLVELLDCSTLAVVDDDFSLVGADTLTLSVPAAGTYLIRFTSSDMTTNGTTAVYSMTSSAGYVLNPIIAYWNDSGTTRQLEACPKMYLPTLVESSGSWYADCTTASSVLTDPLKVSNCVGYAQNPPTEAFTATDSGTSLDFTVTTTAIPVFEVWGSVNLEVGETMPIPYVITPGFPGYGFGVNVYDYTGTLLDNFSVNNSASGTATALSGGAPYTGRYFVRLNGGGFFGPASFSLTSSGVLSVNQIQALYGDGTLLCPNRLNCGDSC